MSRLHKGAYPILEEQMEGIEAIAAQVATELLVASHGLGLMGHEYMKDTLGSSKEPHVQSARGAITEGLGLLARVSQMAVQVTSLVTVEGGGVLLRCPTLRNNERVAGMIAMMVQALLQGARMALTETISGPLTMQGEVGKKPWHNVAASVERCIVHAAGVAIPVFQRWRDDDISLRAMCKLCVTMASVMWGYSDNVLKLEVHTIACDMLHKQGLSQSLLEVSRDVFLLITQVAALGRGFAPPSKSMGEKEADAVQNALLASTVSLAKQCKKLVHQLDSLGLASLDHMWNNTCSRISFTNLLMAIHDIDRRGYWLYKCQNVKAKDDAIRDKDEEIKRLKFQLDLERKARDKTEEKMWEMDYELHYRRAEVKLLDAKLEEVRRPMQLSKGTEIDEMVHLRATRKVKMASSARWKKEKEIDNVGCTL